MLNIPQDFIDIVPFLDHVYLPMDKWQAFWESCRINQIDLNEYLSLAMLRTIEQSSKNLIEIVNDNEGFTTAPRQGKVKAISHKKETK